MRLGASLVALLLLASCGGEPTVDWSKFAPPVRARVEQAVAAEDCDAMQQAFDNADSGANPEKADLMDYLDWHMKRAGCY